MNEKRQYDLVCQYDLVYTYLVLISLDSCIERTDRQQYKTTNSIHTDLLPVSEIVCKIRGQKDIFYRVMV